MSTKKLPTSRRTFVKGTAASAAIAPFFIGRSAKADEQHVMKIATVAPDGTPWIKQAKRMEKLVEKNSEGRIKVKMYKGGAMGGELETLKACKDGRIQCWAGSAGAVSSVVSSIGALELPYLFNSSKSAFKAMGANRTLLHDILWDNGFKLVMFAQNGYRELGLTFEAETPADLKGRKIRIQESKIYEDLFDAWGASGVSMGVTEVLSALQTGVIEGFDNTPLFSTAAGFNSAITHWTVSQHTFQPGLVVMSRKGFWDKLPAELQEALSLDSDDIMKIQDRGIRGVESLGPQVMQNLADMGIKIHKPDLGPWRKVASGVHDKYRKRTTKQGVALLDALKKSM